MRRISRIDRPIGLLRRQRNIQSPSPYLCLACKQQATPFSTSSVRAAPSNEKAPFTEKVRQRIWGTDKPPGLEDPYGDASVFDKTKKGAREAPEQELEARDQESAKLQKEVEESAAGERESVGAHEEATEWYGLEWVGGDPVWKPEEDFEGFAPALKAKGPEEITAALHRAIVEVFAMKQAGKPLHELSTVFPEVSLYGDWTDNVQITPSPSGPTIQMHEDTSLQQVMDSLAATATDEEDIEVEPTESQEDVVADRSEVDPLKPGAIPSADSTPERAQPTKSEKDVAADRSPEDPRIDTSTTQILTYEDVISSWDPMWLQISLENPEVKFAVLKRTMQLTGIRFPDAAIRSSNTAKALLSILVTPPKPRKLADALEQRGDLIQLDNVAIYRDRRTFFDREKDIGRLKVIEEELKSRGLSLYADRQYPNRH